MNEALLYETMTTVTSARSPCTRKRAIPSECSLIGSSCHGRLAPGRDPLTRAQSAPL